MQTLASAIPVFTLILGWLLNEFAARRRWNLDAERRVYDIKLEAYTQWMSGMEQLMNTWTDKNPSVPDLGVINKKLDLLEMDAEARRLRLAVVNSLPDAASDDYHWLAHAQSYDPNFEHQPFRDAMMALVERVRELRPK
jgi:hypothetical protein